MTSVILYANNSAKIEAAMTSVILYANNSAKIEAAMNVCKSFLEKLSLEFWKKLIATLVKSPKMNQDLGGFLNGLPDDEVKKGIFSQLKRLHESTII
ncbi:MAG: hypothetical protein AABZ14_07410, partial [Candidatus Margulisiibacteriota bacterium]